MENEAWQFFERSGTRKELGTCAAQVQYKGKPIVYGTIKLFEEEGHLVVQCRTVGAKGIKAHLADGIEQTVFQGTLETSACGRDFIRGLKEKLGMHPKGTVDRGGMVITGRLCQVPVEGKLLFAPGTRKYGYTRSSSLLLEGGIKQREFIRVCVRIACHYSQEYRLIGPSAKRTQPGFFYRRYSIQTV